MKVGIINLGCPKNTVDTECMLSGLGRFSVTISPDEADMVIVNTCGFLKSARDEAEQNIKYVLSRRKINPGLKVVVAGCLVTKDRQKIIAKYPDVFAWVGVNDIPNIKRAAESGGIYIDSYPYTASCRDRGVSLNTYSAYVKIADGCNHRCSFCIIPSIKGRYRSRRIGDITSEVKSLVASGIREICLISQDSSRYGTDVYGKRSLPQLVRAITRAVKGKFWLRVMYLYPDFAVIKSLVSEMKRDTRICRYFDIPFQHVNDRILKSMRRGYGKNDIIKIIDYIKKELPDAAVRSSFITGYPGEGQKEFSELLDFVKEGRVDKPGFFAYSDEPDARSYCLGGKVQAKEAERRRKILALAWKNLCRYNNSKMVGKTADCLVTLEKPGGFAARTMLNAPDIDTYVMLKRHRGIKPGRFVRAKIKGHDNFDLRGEII